MVIAVTDRTVLDWLATLRNETEIRDAQGRLLGRFVPADQELDDLYREAAAHFDPEELRRRKNTPGPRYTTEEVLRHLNSLGSP